MLNKNTSGKIRRFLHEARELASLNERSSIVDIEPEGDPPTAFQVTVNCRGVCNNPAEDEEFNLVEVTTHRFRMSLGHLFPSAPPEIQWETSIFHPNFNGNEVCLGDLWAGTDSLSDLVVNIVHMVQYKEFNVADPLNRKAADWVRAKLDQDLFPLDNRPVVDLDFDMAVVRRKNTDN
ncbi:MAG: hypothetical protein GKR95_19880 [Gammaproteobacteria bacterium]|nr:hypothetical protein [Gammaproteobacteria bacterium]